MTKADSESRINRREFLRLAGAMGGAAALAAFLESCSPGGADQEFLISPTETQQSPTATRAMEPTASGIPEAVKPTETEGNVTETPTAVIKEGIARVALVRTRDRAEGVRQAIELLGINPVDGKRVFLKPNFNSADPAPGSTHLEVLTALVAALKGMGAEAITVGDRSGMGDTRKVMEQIGVFELAEMLGFETVVFDDLGAEDWALVEPPNSHWQRGFLLARPCLGAGAVVQTGCLKTHRYGGHFTMSLKNSVGLVAKRSPQDGYDFMRELHGSPHQRRMIAEINTAYTPALIVMDGVEAFISGGPDQGEQVAAEVVLAGTDRVAMDAVGVAVLRYFGCRTEAGQGRIFEQEQIARAAELGLGVEGPERIELVTGDADSKAYGEEIREVLLGG